MEREHFDILIVGSGVAGMSAAVSAMESLLETGTEATLAVIERASETEAGGSSRHTEAYLRMDASMKPAETFEEDIMSFSEGRSDPRMVRRLGEEAESTLRWLQGKGVVFEALPTAFLTSRRPRLLPVGGGRAIIEALGRRLRENGVPILYETTALRLILDDSGRVGGLEVRSNRDGLVRRITCHAVVLACGGFEGNPEMLARYMGEKARNLRNISRGGLYNKGECIQMALQVGAKPAGEWTLFHAEPVDPRSSATEPLLAIFPYGVLVNRQGRRFIDEGEGTVDETYEKVARAVLEQDGQIAYLVLDQKLYSIPDFRRAIKTPEPPVEAETLGDLAEKLGIDKVQFIETIEEFNRAVQEGPFDPLRLDGKRTAGINPPKSNWAQRIDSPPYLAYPFACAIVFTFGGVATNEEAEVLSSDDIPIPGLYAAGEVVGMYYAKYPGATSVLRGLVFGRIAGRNAARYVRRLVG